MSWDAILVRIKGKGVPQNAWEADEIPLGPRKQVLDAIRTEFPTVEQQSSTEWLYVDGDLSIDFRIPSRSPVREVMLEVRGQGDPITPLLHLATTNGWLVMDVSMSAYLDPADPSNNGYGDYRKMTRQILAPKRAAKKKATARQAKAKAKTKTKTKTKKTPHKKK